MFIRQETITILLKYLIKTIMLISDLILCQNFRASRGNGLPSHIFCPLAWRYCSLAGRRDRYTYAYIIMLYLPFDHIHLAIRGGGEGEGVQPHPILRPPTGF